MTYLSKNLLLGLIIVLFIIKGVLLSVLIPPFQNPDEQVHYGTIQYRAEPVNKSWPIRDGSAEHASNMSDVMTFHFSEEILQSSSLVQFDQIKWQKENTQYFSDTSTGVNEEKITSNSWKRYIDTLPPSASTTKSVYYLFASWLERFSSEESIFVRILFMRLLASAFGVGSIILAYLIAKKIGFSKHTSILFTILIAFQPMFSITSAQINIDISLIFSFSLFLYAGISLLKDGAKWQHALLAISAAILGLFSKGPGIVLIIMLYPLFAWVTYQKFRVPKKRFFLMLIGATIMLIGIMLLTVPTSYFISITNSAAQSKFDSPLESLGKYVERTVTPGELRDTSLSYWGHFGWLDNAIPNWTLSIIILMSIIGFAGMLMYVFSSHHTSEYLPERKYLIFFLGTIIALQFAIRFFDWRVFDYTGQILIGQPGRYFLPNLIGHIIIIITGIGFLLGQEKRLALTMKLLALAMILLQLYAIINVIIPRYYL